jgi:death-on-curing protein
VSSEPEEPRWVSRTIVLAIHADQIRQHGGARGLRDEGLLESALERPRNREHYEPGADVHRIAAAYGYGLARNHAFVDGNKRVAFQVMYVFLGLNGYRVAATEADVVSLILRVAEGSLEEEPLADWLRGHTCLR